MDFSSDNVFGVHEAILASLSEANVGSAPSYGYDDWTKSAEAALERLFEKDVRAFLVATGTAANGLALASVSPPHGAVLCHVEAHISTDECGAPEFFSGGVKLLGIRGRAGKLSAESVEKRLKGFVRGEHESKPSALSISQASELGTIYSPSEISRLSEVCKSRSLKLHMDGARFANALVELGCTPAEATWKAGIDVLSFGGTKNGAMALEAVIFFDAKIADDFLYRRKRAGQLLSKGRFLGAQMVAYLNNNLWLDNARQANGMARLLAQHLASCKNMRLPLPTQANEVFAVMPRSLFEALISNGVHCYEWLSGDLDTQAPLESECLARFVTSFRTTRESVEEFGMVLSRVSK